MLKKLQQRFIMTNMLLVGVVLATVFIISYVSTYSSSIEEIDSSMRKSIEFVRNTRVPIRDLNSTLAGPPPYRPNNRVPTVTVAVTKSGQITKVYQDLMALPMNDIQALVYTTIAHHKTPDMLADSGWRFLKLQYQDTTYISLAGTISLKEEMQKTLLVSIALAVGSMIVFFFISLFMAKISIRPVRRAWNQQQQFVSDASHELKTPLTVIMANNNILLSKPASTIHQQQKWIQSTQAEATHMKALINSMLYLAKSDETVELVEYSSVSLSDICTDCFLQFQPVAFEKNLALEADVQEGITLLGNMVQLKQLAHILMDNACKYSEPGDRIYASLKLSGNIIKMSIQNNTTIDSQDLPHLFERFYRSDKARTHQNGEGGFGLGLSIAKSIVERHRGKISVISDPKAGTVFSITFKQKND